MKTKRSRFNVAITLSIAVCFLAISGCKKDSDDSSKTSWHQFISPDGMIQVKFPVKPKLIEKTAPSAAGELQIAMGVAEVNKKLAYIATSMLFPVDPASYSVQAGLDGAVANIKGTVIEDQKISKGGFPGRELLVETPEGLFVRAVTYIDGTGPAMIQLNITAGSQKVLKSANAEKFFNSIVFMGKKDSAIKKTKQ